MNGLSTSGRGVPSLTESEGDVVLSRPREASNSFGSS